VRDTGEIFKLVENIKVSKNINFYIPIYSDAGTGVENIKFSKKYKVPAERTDRKIVTDIKISARP
jgi:hypothetical protein